MGFPAMAGVVPSDDKANRCEGVRGRRPSRCSAQRRRGKARAEACRHSRDVFVPEWKLNWLNRDFDAAALTQTRIRTSGGASAPLTIGSLFSSSFL